MIDISIDFFVLIFICASICLLYQLTYISFATLVALVYAMHHQVSNRFVNSNQRSFKNCKVLCLRQQLHCLMSIFATHWMCGQQFGARASLRLISLLFWIFKVDFLTGCMLTRGTASLTSSSQGAASHQIGFHFLQHLFSSVKASNCNSSKMAGKIFNMRIIHLKIQEIHRCLPSLMTNKNIALVNLC